ARRRPPRRDERRARKEDPRRLGTAADHRRRDVGRRAEGRRGSRRKEIEANRGTANSEQFFPLAARRNPLVREKTPWQSGLTRTHESSFKASPAARGRSTPSAAA